MPKAMQILFIPLLMFFLCSCKEKELPPKQVAWGEKPKSVKEECESLCKAEQEKKMRDTYLQREGYFEGCGCSFEGCNPSCEAKNREEIEEKRRYKSYLQINKFFKETQAEYEEAFQKKAPKCKECEDCDYRDRYLKIDFCLESLSRALKLGVPYPAIEEKIVLDRKIKAAYNNRFGLPITDFELSLTSVYYEIEESGIDYMISRAKRGNHPSFSAVRTATGAKAKYYDDEADFSTGDWLDFIMALRKCQVNKWDTVYMAPREKSNGYNGSWVLEVYYLDKDGYISNHRTESYEFEGEYAPPNWKDFNITIRRTEAKIERMATAKAKAKK